MACQCRPGLEGFPAVIADMRAGLLRRKRVRTFFVRQSYSVVDILERLAIVRAKAWDNWDFTDLVKVRFPSVKVEI